MHQHCYFVRTFTKSSRPAILDVLEPGYGPLFDRLVAVLGDDERVRGMWLSGSLARGEADRISDLDVLVAVRDDDHDAFAAEWREWLAAVTPTLIARPLPFAPGSFYSLTPGRQRLDVVVETMAWLPNTPFRSRLTVFDRDGLDQMIPAPEPGAGLSAERVAGLIEEFFRDYGMFPVVTEREDWLLGQEGVHFVRGLLYQLFVEENAPLPMMGIKRWSTKLTPEQRAVLTSLPAAAPNRESVMTAHHAVGEAFLVHARRVCDRLGVVWPAELEAATVDYLRSYGLA